MSEEAKQAAKRTRTAYDNAQTLLAKRSNLKLTPLQTVLQFFELAKASHVGKLYHQSLREVLDLLPQCDWSVVHPNGWVAMDPEGRTKSTIVTPEMLVKRHIEPLLGPIDDTSEFLRQLASMSETEKDALHLRLARRLKAARENPLPENGGKREGAGRPFLDKETQKQALAERLRERLAEARENPLSQHGGVQKINQASNRSLINHGENQSYLLSRIARDNPDMLGEIGPGKKYRSARQAAIAAGIIRDAPQMRMSDPDKVAESVVTRLGREWAAALAARLTELLTEEAP